MGDMMDITGGIVVGGLILLLGSAEIITLEGNSTKKELQDLQTITGTVVEENFRDWFMRDEYQVSIRTSKGRKILVSYKSNVSGLTEPTSLNTLFAKGDYVELSVGTNEKFDGSQRFVGLAGKLVEDKMK